MLDYFAPSTGSVIAADRRNEIYKGLFTQLVMFIYLNRSCRFVARSLIDELVRIRCYWIIDKDVYVIFGCLQCADIALQHEVRPIAPLYGFYNFWLSLVHQCAHIEADLSLPVW